MATLFFILSFCFLIYFLFCKVGFLKHLGVQYTTICILNRLVLPLPTLCMLNTCYYVKVMTWDMMVLALMAFCLKRKRKKRGLRYTICHPLNLLRYFITTRAINLSSIIYEKMLAIGYQCGLYFGQILISILFEGRERPHFGPRTHMS